MLSIRKQAAGLYLFEFEFGGSTLWYVVKGSRSEPACALYLFRHPDLSQGLLNHLPFTNHKSP